MRALEPDEIERYARHLVLPEIGGPGQQKLCAANVLVVGAGGLGSPVIQYLAAAGVGRLAIADDDDVSLSNLQRQVIHTTAHVDTPKVDSANRGVAAINDRVTVKPIHDRATAQNLPAMLDDMTIAVDCSDNFDTRYALADACAEAEVPLVTAAVGRFDGSLTTLTPWDGPSYRDIFPAPPPPGTVASCAEAGVVGAITGIMGTLQTMEVIKLITGAGEPLIGRLLMVDALAMRFETLEY